MWAWLLVSTLIIAVAAFGLRWFLSPIVSSWRDPSPLSYAYTLVVPGEATATRRVLPLEAPFPQALLFDDATRARADGANRVTLSCIVPAYNEAERSPVMMEEALEYLTARAERESDFTFEIVVVDDGSRDATGDTIQSFVTRYGPERVRLLKLARNQGKGGAVQQGMLHARGDLLLMVDADGASRFSDVAKLEREIMRIRTHEGHGIAVGSRRHLQEDAVATRAFHRNLMMYVFHFLVATLTGIRHIADTQCGFKLFTRATAQYLFVNQHLRRWCFDVELLYLAMRSPSPIPVVEVPINWSEIPGSKINLFESAFVMTRDMLLIRLAYTLGLWQCRPWTTIRANLLHAKGADTNRTVRDEDPNIAKSSGKQK